MGRVDLALDPSLDPPELRVLKTMNTDEPTPDAEARFRREANIAMQLSHDAIARTVAIENIDGDLCLVQEFVEGVDLSLLQRQSAPKRLPISTACFVASEVARALTHAHGKGVIHRDVTPNNVMLSYTGAVKLIDFGIAKAVTDPKLTQLGVIVGREIFIPPEVCAGSPADQRADVYALGVVLWEALVGRKMIDVVHGDDAIPDPCTLVTTVPTDLGAAVMKALARAPEDRFQTAGELRDNLTDFFADDASGRTELADFIGAHFEVDRERKYLLEDIDEAKRILAGPRSNGARPGRGRLPWIGIAACVAALIGATAVAVTLHGRSEPPSAHPIAAPAPEPNAPRSLDTPRVATFRPASPEAPPTSAGELPEVRAGRSAPGHKAMEKGHPGTTAAGSPVPASVSAPDPKGAADLLREANRLWTAGQGDDGLALARQAVRRGGGSSAHVLIGTILMSKHDVPAAEREFSEAVKLDPNDREARHLLDFAKRNNGE